MPVTIPSSRENPIILGSLVWLEGIAVEVLVIAEAHKNMHRTLESGKEGQKLPGVHDHDRILRIKNPD
jgi:hypothetical protein